MANIGDIRNIQRDDHTVNNPQVNNKKSAKLHIEAMSLTIGGWRYIAQQPLGAVAKWYFGRKKIIWEILENGLKKKIEISWCNLSAIGAIVNDNKPEILQVLLNDRPSFFEEIPATKYIHTRWKKTSDFTNGNAQQFRIHLIQFAPGFLKKRYEELLGRWPLFKQLSECPFPGFDESPLFGDLQYINYNGHEQQSDLIRQNDPIQATVNFSQTSVMSQYNPVIVNKLRNTSGNVTNNRYELPSNPIHQNPGPHQIDFYENDPHLYKSGDHELNDYDSFENKEIPKESEYELFGDKNSNTMVDSVLFDDQLSFDVDELLNWDTSQQAKDESQPLLYSKVDEDDDYITSLLSSAMNDPNMHSLDWIDIENVNFQSPQVENAASTSNPNESTKRQRVSPPTKNNKPFDELSSVLCLDFYKFQ